MTDQSRPETAPEPTENAVSAPTPTLQATAATAETAAATATSSAEAVDAHKTQPPRHDLSHMLFSASVPGTEIKKQISHIAPGQTAKALMLIYLTFSVPIVLLGSLVNFFKANETIPLSTVATEIFSAMLLNAVIGFILLWIACQAYNWVASRFGGIEITLSDTPEEL